MHYSTDFVFDGTAGEPYDDASAQDIVRRLTRYHSAYYVKPDRPPAPLFISAGFTDDLRCDFGDRAAGLLGVMGAPVGCGHGLDDVGRPRLAPPGCDLQNPR